MPRSLSVREQWVFAWDSTNRKTRICKTILVSPIFWGGGTLVHYSSFPKVLHCRKIVQIEIDEKQKTQGYTSPKLLYTKIIFVLHYIIHDLFPFTIDSFCMVLGLNPWPFPFRDSWAHEKSHCLLCCFFFMTLLHFFAQDTAESLGYVSRYLCKSHPRPSLIHLIGILGILGPRVWSLWSSWPQTQWGQHLGNRGK